MSRRLDRVNELLKREISSVLQRDFEWKGSLVTVNAVEVSQDLKDARVYIGVLGGHEEKVIHRLNGERGSIQGRVMKRVVLKNTPVLRFVGDDSVVRGVDIVNLLDEVAELPVAPPEEEGDGETLKG
ncbi:MAG TPA: 30S ribosome-binding factor RbfA [Verrucomicrobiales bacterium]|nr:30S ribosome-binding factor RbfA [Verrucomicrobiales bacterium]